jgi:DNA adenine methylase
MQYLGGKSRIAKQLVNFMSLERESNMTWIEPFVGSAKVISLVGGHRIGSDINHEMIALFKALQNGYEPPGEVSEEFYNEVKQNQDQYPDHLKAFLSIGCSFGAKRWDVYARNNKGYNYALTSKNSLNRLRPLIQDVEFLCSDYKDLKVPSNSLIYCDPPYKGTSGYGFHFDHEEFYQWCRDKVKQGHLVFVSEYQAPDDFQCVWSKKTFVSVCKDQVSHKEEKLFRVHKPKNFSLRIY